MSYRSTKTFFKLPVALLVGGLFAALLTKPAIAAEDAKRELEAVVSEIQPLLDAHKGEVSVAIKHLDSGETFKYRADEPMPTASLIKVPVMITAYLADKDGTLSMDQPVVLRDSDKVPGSGILTANFSEGTQMSLEDAIHLMIVYSDNTATNLVIDQIGLDATTRLMKSLGCPNTRLHSKVYRRDTSIEPERSKQFGLGSTTADEMISLLEGIYKGELVSKAACKKMLGHMKKCGEGRLFKRLLPPRVAVAQKGGSVSWVRTAAGIVYTPGGPVAVCVLTAKNVDQGKGDSVEAELLISKVARSIYDHFSPKTDDAQSSDLGIVRVGASGRIVRLLQATLNAKSKPSPDIAVDGEFGPMTERAVCGFQKASGLDPTGVVGPETWAALGTLVPEDADLPDPEVVNAEVIKKQPADQLTGPPFVTCKAWAIGRADSGKLLWGSHEDEPRDMASTTKIMTALLVATLADEDPSVLDERVEFSKRADNTIGSSAGMTVGESVSAGELLYGLLLPSGNDASVALAEHFGPRLAPPGYRGSDPYGCFIAAMNAMAAKLSLSNTAFANPNGLTEKGHHTSARDLMVLASQAMKQPLLRKVVGTVQHGAKVTGPGGYTRNVVWRNTNRLLKTEGYCGVKTGTTSAAGSCLVSCGKRGDRELIVVVLGSSSTDARYADSRNLFRWAWNQIEQTH